MRGRARNGCNNMYPLRLEVPWGGEEGSDGRSGMGRVGGREEGVGPLLLAVMQLIKFSLLFAVDC